MSVRVSRPSRWLPLLAVVAAPLVLVATMPTPAEADTTYTVGKNETIDQVAKKYGVTVKALVSTNKLKDPSHLKPGTKLTIPGKSGPVAIASSVTAAKYTGAPKHKGRAVFVRLVNGERREVQLVDMKGKLVAGVMPMMSRLMRFPATNAEHEIDKRLVQNLATVSDHFGGKSMEIISGFRPKTPNQYTAHSNHNVGCAMDFRIQGVPNEVLRDYCKTFKNVGVGYYPNSLFVHFDVRTTNQYWVDLSGPGQAPRYVNPSTWQPTHGQGWGDLDNPYGEGGTTAASTIPSAGTGRPASTATTTTTATTGGTTTMPTLPAPTATAPPAATGSGKK